MRMKPFTMHNNFCSPLRNEMSLKKAYATRRENASSANRSKVHGPSFSKLSIELNKQRKSRASRISKAQFKYWEPVTRDGKYSIEEIIGKGSFGTVAKAYDHKRKCHVAIKRLKNFAKNEYQSL